MARSVQDSLPQEGSRSGWWRQTLQITLEGSQQRTCSTTCSILGMGFGKSRFPVAQVEGRLDSLIEFAALLLFKT